MNVNANDCFALSYHSDISMSSKPIKLLEFAKNCVVWVSSLHNLTIISKIWNNINSSLNIHNITFFNVSRFKIVFPKPSRITFFWVDIMTIASILCISIESVYHSISINALSIVSNWLQTLSPNSQVAKAEAKDQIDKMRGRINSTKFLEFYIPNGNFLKKILIIKENLCVVNQFQKCISILSQ